MVAVAAAVPETLGTRAARGAFFSVGGQLISQLLRLGSNLALARLLDPEAFGLMAIVLAVTTGLALISDVGIWQAIIRSPRGNERDFLDTAWTLSLLRGATLFVIGCALTIPAALFYGRDELLWLLPLCALQALFYGAESTKTQTTTRSLKVGRVVLMEVAAQVVALLLSIPVALATRSVAALLVAALAAATTRVLMSHFFLEGPRNRLRWEKRALHEIFSFGGWIFVSTLLYFAGTRWDVFALGRLEGMALVGVYGLAQMITLVPTAMGEKVTGFVLMPALAESFRESPEAFADDLKRARSILLPSAAVMFLGAAMTAPAFFQLLYRDVYGSAGWMTQLLVLVAWCAFIQDASSRALLALGDSRSLARANAARFVATVIFTAIGFTQGSVIGFMIGNACGALTGVVVVGRALGRKRVDVLAFDLLATLAFVVIGAIGCGLPVVLAPRLGISPSMLSMGGVVVLLGPIAWVVVMRARVLLRR